MMHGAINVKSPNNISKWQMGFNSAFKGLKHTKNLAAGTLEIVRMLNHNKNNLLTLQRFYSF
jgi:hypothetical protein